MTKEAKKVNSSRNSKKEIAVQSIHRAAEILSCISDGISSLTNIAQKCKLSKSTVHRLLRALGESELVIQDPVNHQYFLGYSIIKLVYNPLATQEYLTRCASDEMIRLSGITGESISLGVKIGMNNVNIHAVDSNNPLKVVGTNFKIRLLHLGVDGSILLSQLDDNQVLKILDNIRLEFKAKSKNINTEELVSRICAIRQQGYAIGYNEFTSGVTCISAPVRNYALPTVLNVVGPETRMKPNMKKLVRDVVEYAAIISDKLKLWRTLGLHNL
jgi:IclR family KDG regulon transcriptional repressor